MMNDRDRILSLPKFEFHPLQEAEQRFFILEPTKADGAFVRCELSVDELYHAPPFIAVNNARGFRLLQRPIEVDGKQMWISAALESFLRAYSHQITEPTRLWIRHLCVDEADPVERATLWTRDWSDIMYALAVEVVDMNAFNADLVDKGVIEKVFPPGQQRKKEWYAANAQNEGYRQIVFPKVFPFRLGVQWVHPDSNETATADYLYMPLDTVVDEVRLAVIDPPASSEAPIKMGIAHSPISSNVTYFALSYRWGYDAPECLVDACGQRLLIRRSLDEAIRAITPPDTTLPIWIDAMSINQEDLQERARQVVLMNKIYYHATRVMCYIGPASADSDMALEFIKALQTPVVDFNSHKQEWHFGPVEYNRDTDDAYGENKYKPVQLSRAAAALYKLLTRSYFRRGWILQEIAFATDPTICVGTNCSTPFYQLEMAVYNLKSMLMRDPRLIEQMLVADPSVGEVLLHNLDFPRKLFYLRHIISDGARYMSPLIFTSRRADSPGLLEVLILTRDFQCTDLRDKIFSVWTIAQDKKGLEFSPDYTLRTRDIYVQCAMAWIKQHRSLDILGAVEASPGSEKFYSGTPSWCPDWANPTISSCLVRHDNVPEKLMSSINDLDGPLYSADGDAAEATSASPTFDFEGEVLCCTGLILDSNEMFLPEPPEPLDGHPFAPGSAFDSFWAFQFWAKTLAHHFSSRQDANYEDPLQAATAMMHGDCVSAWSKRAEKPYSQDEQDPYEIYICRPRRKPGRLGGGLRMLLHGEKAGETEVVHLADPNKVADSAEPKPVSRHITYLATDDGYDRSQARAVARRVLRGRRPFVTEKGYMGLAPAYVCDAAQNGEKDTPTLLAVVAKCSVPLLLRQRDDGTYQLCGTCFVQGWMEGEALCILTGTANLKEVWLKAAEGPRLKIA